MLSSNHRFYNTFYTLAPFSHTAVILWRNIPGRKICTERCIRTGICMLPDAQINRKNAAFRCRNYPMSNLRTEMRRFHCYWWASSRRSVRFQHACWFTNKAVSVELKVQQPKYWRLHKISWDKINNLLIMPFHVASQPEVNLPQQQLSPGPTEDAQRWTTQRENSQFKSRCERLCSRSLRDDTSDQG